MRWLALVVALAGCGAPTGAARDAGVTDAGLGVADAGPADPVFAADRIIPAELTLSPASIAALTTAPETYAAGSLAWDGEVVAVEVRLKGLRSFRPLGQKASFRLRFATPFHGLRHLVLNGAVQDPSFASQTLFYELARAAGVPAPRTGYVALTVDGEPYGLYVSVEVEDPRFLARWFAAAGGNLYEGNLQDLDPGSAAAFDLETNVTANDRSDLAALIAAVAAAPTAGWHAALDPVLASPGFFRFAAVEGVGADEDGYAYGYGEVPPNNYRLYDDPTTGRFAFVPWGADTTLQHDTSIFGIRGRVLYACVAEPACKADYVAEVDRVLGVFTALDLPARADAIHALVAAAVAADPKKELDLAAYEAAVAAQRALLVGRVDVVRQALGAVR